jgi:hypothetical protein
MDGKPVPPPHFVKELTVRRYGRKFQCKILIESGTFLGDMVEAQRGFFERTVSIELAQPLFEKARDRFRNDRSVDILRGDSGVLLKQIVPALDRPSLFWLDGHYSAGETAKANVSTPILKELEAAFGTKETHVILIDDARLFNGTDDYPTLDEIRIKCEGLGYSMAVQDDIIRLVKTGR